VNKLTIQNERIFLNEKEIEFVKGFELKSSTDGTAELTLRLLVDLDSMSLCQHGGNDLAEKSVNPQKVAERIYEESSKALPNLSHSTF
jgi:hypothetical protein